MRVYIVYINGYPATTPMQHFATADDAQRWIEKNTKPSDCAGYREFPVLTYNW